MEHKEGKKDEKGETEEKKQKTQKGGKGNREKAAHMLVLVIFGCICLFAPPDNPLPSVVALAFTHVAQNLVVAIVALNLGFRF
jgi:hypothetical protein